MSPRIRTCKTPGGFRRALPIALCASLLLSTAAVADVERLDAAYRRYFGGVSAGHRALAMKELTGLAPLGRGEAEAAVESLWSAYQKHSPEATLRKAAAAQRLVMVDGEPLYYTLEAQGERGANGYAVFIDMHGGGGVAPQVHDHDWQVHQRRYKVPGKFVAVRAPRDTWDSFHNAYFHRFTDALVEQLILAEDVDPNRVYLMGFSSGGYGVIQLAPTMPDRFAAAACSAAATEGSRPENLRNLPLIYQVGEHDHAVNRATWAKAYAEELATLHEADPDGYTYHFKLHEGRGHGFDDRAAPGWMAKHTRDPFPRRIVWWQNHQANRGINPHAHNSSNPIRHQMYWVAVSPAIHRDQTGTKRITAQINGQAVILDVDGYPQVSVRLNDALVDLDKPVTIQINGVVVHEGMVERRPETLLNTFLEKRDPTYTFAAALTLDVPRNASEFSAAAQSVPEALRGAWAQSLEEAGGNAPRLVKALLAAKPEHRPGLAYLIAHMPRFDLREVSPEYLLENTRLAYAAAANAPWADRLDSGHFNQYILPYRCINERRDWWRDRFYKKLSPKAWEFETPLEAATWINDEFEALFGVKFHATKRPKPDQSPLESIDAGYASCTGLSILMVDACRSVGIPARFVGVPRWHGLGGNHNWVEVWDGRWYNIGSSGSDPRKDDWVDDRAGKHTVEDEYLHAVYAVTWRRGSGARFPLIWNLSFSDLYAANITRFYTHRRDVSIDLADGRPATVEAWWNGELVARAHGSGSVALPLAGGLSFDLVVTYDDKKQEAPERRTFEVPQHQES